MAQLVVGAISAAVGFAVAGPTGAQIGWAIGTAIAAPTQKVRSPRLDDLKVTGAEYGQPIPWVRGHPRVAGQLWWSSDKREVSTTTSVGKGGGVEQTTYTYQVDLLYGLTSSEIQGISRVWSNGKLIYSRLDGTTTDSLANSAGANSWDRITCYTGAADQLPDPTYEAAVGVGNAPAYRGRGTVFIEGLQLGSSGQIPNLTFEVFTSGTETPTCVTADEDVLLQLCFEGADGSTTFTDSSLYAHPVVRGGSAEIDTSQFACGTSSLYCLPAFGSASAALDEFELSDFTVRFFFKANSDNDRVYFGRITSTTHGWRFRYENIGKQFIFTNYRVPFTGPGPNVFTKAWDYAGSSFAWHEIVLVVIAGDPALYVDGVLLGVTSDSGNAEVTYVDTEVFCIGMPRPGASTLRCNGWFDDVQVIARALTSDEITGECTSNIDVVVLDNDTLQETVETLCEKAGMPAGTYDATALASITKPIRALAVSQVTPARTVLEQLAAGYFFEAYATDKLYFVARGGSVALSIPVDDLGAGEDQATEEALPVTISSDEQIPAQIALTYSNVDSDYNTATEYSDRLISGIVDTRTIALPMGFTASEAKGISDAMLADEYASRVAGQAALTLKYSRLVPTDVVTLTSPDGAQYRARLVRRTEGRVLVAYEWVVDDATAIESSGITSDDYTPSITVNLPGPTSIELMDIPILRDADNSPGIYVAAKPTRGTWPGYQLLQSIDSGVEYTDAGTGTSRAIFGETTTALTTWAGGNVFDEKGSVTVDVGGATLSSATRDDLLNSDANAMLIGSEVIQYRTATLVTAGVYTLTGLLRGRRGTEWAMTSHAIGEPAVLLRVEGILRVSYDSTRIGIDAYYKGVTLGKRLSSATAHVFNDSGIAVRPFSPVDIRVSRSSSTDIVIAWKRRTRFRTQLGGASGITVPLGEAAEAYVVRIYSDSGYTTLLRTISTAEQEATYTAVQQFEDGSALLSALYVQVEQLGVNSIAGYTASQALAIPVAAPNSFSSTYTARPIGAFDGELLAIDLGTVSSVITYRMLVSLDDGVTWDVSYQGPAVVGGSDGVRYFDGLLPTVRLGILQNVSAAITNAVTASDNVAAPTSTDPSPSISGAYIYPVALYADTVAATDVFRLIGRRNDASSTAGLSHFESTDGITWTLVGELAQDAADPNELPALTYGAFEPNTFWPFAPVNALCTLQLFGSRWFLHSDFAIYYTDDPTLVTGWLRAPTGLGEGSSNPWTSIGGVVEFGSWLVAYRKLTYGFLATSSVSYSTDNGETWTAIRPTAQGADDLSALYVHGSELVLVLLGGTPRVLKATDPSGTWTSHNISGATAGLRSFVASGSNIVARDAFTRQLMYSADSVTWQAATVTES